MFPAWPFAAPWSPRPPPPPLLCLAVFVAAARCPSFFSFFLPALLLPAGSALVSGSRRPTPPLPFSCLFCWSPAARLSVCSCCFCASCPAVGCSLVVAAPPPLLCLVVFVAAAQCSVFFSFFFLCCFALACLLGARRRFSRSAAPPPPLSCCLSCWSPAARLPVCSCCFCVSRLAVGCPLVVAAPPLCVSRFSSQPLGAPFFFLSLLRCSRLLAWRSSAVLAVCCLASPLLLCVRGALCCLVLPRCAALPSRVLQCRVAVFRLYAVWFAVWFWSVLPCAGLCCVSLGAVLRRAAARSGVVLLRAVFFRCARWVLLLVVPCPLALPAALAPSALRRCVLRCSSALYALCCVCFVVACWCAVMFAAVPCAVCVLGCRDVRSLSSPLCAVLCMAVLVRLRGAVRVVPAVASAWCCGALLRVLLFPLVFCGAVVVRGCLLVACLLGCCLCLLCPPVACRAVLCCAVGWYCCP